jgi:hypothetical protein
MNDALMRPTALGASSVLHGTESDRRLSRRNAPGRWGRGLALLRADGVIVSRTRAV